MVRSGASVVFVSLALGLAGCDGATAEEALCDGASRGDGFVGGGPTLEVAVLEYTPVEVSRAALAGIEAWGMFGDVRWRYASRGEPHDPNVLYTGTCPGDYGRVQFAFARDHTGLGWAEADLESAPQTPERLAFIATHEVGHLLGLGHYCGDPASVMCEGGVTRPPTEGDLDEARRAGR